MAAAENEKSPPAPATGKEKSRVAWMSLVSLGVVYGDIGTSPLYAVRECFFGAYGVAPSEANVLGVLSLIAWSLLFIISTKYLLFVLRADYDGEGGILVLMELVMRPVRGRMRKAILTVGLFGAALLYGDGMITPAISVLSAIEGLEVATPVFRPYVIPLTVAILVFLFLFQRLGSGSVGKLFGPVMLIWFAVLAAGGIVAIVRQPLVLSAISPHHGVTFLLHHGLEGFSILGIVFLVVTGGEALYADIGHFGTAPIRIGWYTCVLPSLLLNYFGQGALILARPGQIVNPFYQLVTPWMLYPLVALAACATVIASQAVISGAFSLSFQAVQLGYLPRLDIRHTSATQRGQIYVPLINWVLCAAAVALVLLFRRSGNLASAYGMSISTTMVITSLLFFFAMRQVLAWPLPLAAGLTAAFLAVDLIFFLANTGKFFDGGWFPILAAAGIFLLMTTWRQGFAMQRRKSRNRILPIREFLIDIGGGGRYRRVPGQAVYLAGNSRGTPHSLVYNLRHNRALHNLVVIYSAVFVKAPHVHEDKRLKVTKLREDITRVVAYYGFMESPDVPKDLAGADRLGKIGLDLEKVTYFVGGDILMPEEGIGLVWWRSRLYALMARNKLRATSYLNLPAKQVFEIGAHIEV